MVRFETCSCIEQEGGLVIIYRCQDTGNVNSLHLMMTPPPDTVKVGILEVDDSGKVTSFLEKPSPDSTPSRNAVSYSNAPFTLVWTDFSPVP